MQPTEFAQALGRAIAAGMVEAGLLESTEPKRAPARRPKQKRRARQQPALDDPPPRPLADVADEALERQRHDAAYSLDAEEPELRADEMSTLERLFASPAERKAPELDRAAQVALERKLHLPPRREDDVERRYDPNKVEELDRHVMGRP